MKLDGIAAIVTGGGSGLGEATARALAAKGAKVAICDVNTDGAEAVAKDIGGLAVACDVSSSDNAREAIETAEARHGIAQVLVNCAGIGTPGKILGRDGPLELEIFSRVVQVNLIGTFNMMRLAAARMAEAEPGPSNERGVIVNTASIAAYEGQIGQAAYASSKGGVVGLTLPAAREFARHGIRVCTIAPGLFGTPMLRGLPQEAQDSLAASVPFPVRLGEPDEYAALALHIAENQMLNGEVIRLDGALRMAPK